MRTDLEEYLIEKERGFLATVGRNGEPTIVPVCFVYSDGMIYTAVDRKPKKKGRLARTQNILLNEQVAFIADTYVDDWRRLSYGLVHGKADIVANLKESRMAKEMLVSKYPQYRWLGLRDSQIIRIKVQRAKLWRFSRTRLESAVRT